MRLSLSVLTLVASASIVACSAASEDVATGDQAVVAPDKSDKTATTKDAVTLMNEVWRGHDFDYLPWAYSPDGCFARSFFVSMEFASRGIPVREQIINVRWNSDFESNKAEFEPTDPSGAPVLYNGRTVKWQYHIAAVLMPGDKVDLKEPMIIDRALEPGPVTVAKWVSDANSHHLPVAPPDDAPITADDNGVPTRGYNQLKTKGAPYVGVGTFLNGNWASFEGEPERMPTYDPSLIQLACDTVWTIWVDCMGADEKTTTEMMSARANTLVANLDAQHALAEGTSKPAAPITCTRNEKFQCFGHANSNSNATAP